MGRTLASLGRLRQISAVVVRHGLGHLLEGRRRPRRRSNDPAEALALAGRFRRVLEELGTTFVKFGQVLSTRGDLLPPGFADALRGLQDSCAPLPFSDIESQWSACIGRPLAESFADFDPVPKASASVAQVHRARTRDGRDVAVKVQRPGLAEQVGGDLDLLRLLAQLLDAIVEESGIVTSRGVVDAFETLLLQELDFAHELRQMQRFAANAAGAKGPRTYVVPQGHPTLSASRVLTMDWLEGRRIAELSPGPEAERVAANVVQAAFDQMFVDGLFHADPHPGNCLVLQDGRLGLIDYGATARLSYSMRETLVVLVLSIGMNDAGAVSRLLYRVGIPEERVNLNELRDACGELMEEKLRDREAFAAQNAAALLQDLFALAARFRVRVPSSYALIGRAAMTVEGILRQLDPGFTVIERARPMLRRLLEEQFSVQQLGGSTVRGLLRARDVLRELPNTVTQLTSDLEYGKLRLQVDNPQLGQIARNIDTLGVVVFMGLVASGLVGGSLTLLGRYDWRLYGLPVVPLVGLYVASMLFGTALGRYFLAPRMRKVSLGRLLRRRR